MKNPKEETSARLKNSLKKSKLTINEALKIDKNKLKSIGFSNASIIELHKIK